ncbi:2,3-bisphosphoglycerate-dependent phosphoglycerate mutase isoform X1 [Bactrocera oleae]|uniref:2,3-bisphosphoglycerate-dependent phosphoglycerate mutase isoform X1 n=2 Tax=Bactrocera oleae TaxID=104688 RepID=UPI00174805D3|nr:2,3-bisphosphoglycerate-dependent phosphoglycerate mutase isoform X1 [Bactrocera oleae]
MAALVAAGAGMLPARVQASYGEDRRFKSVCLVAKAKQINMKTNQLVIVRHGESEWNKLNLFCGWHDADLSEQGAKDAINTSAVALRESNLKFDIAYSSALMRARQSLSIILKELNLCDLEVVSDWHLNERHYGNLTGYNKRDMANKYGEEQVQSWRRKYDVLPPPITPDNPYYHSIRNNPSFKNIPASDFPDTESLKVLMQRVIPYFENVIFKQVLAGKRVLIIAHGTVARALIKHIDKVSDENISTVNVPNSIPCLFEFNTETGEKVGITTFLADENFLNEQIQKTASIGESNK